MAYRHTKSPVRTPLCLGPANAKSFLGQGFLGVPDISVVANGLSFCGAQAKEKQARGVKKPYDPSCPFARLLSHVRGHREVGAKKEA